ncbi:hypothetical protein BC835DRAFT_695137 [Cytidiella melzeri]|nr:hypothetical protein BC835DRAFT_695137 [Cytidiella melzeri]
MSQSSGPSLVGAVVERKAGLSIPPAVKTSGKTGFPVAQHRSRSAFSRARDEQKKADGSSRLPRPPAVTRAAGKPPIINDIDKTEDESSQAHVIAQASDEWRRQIEEENQRRVESMSPEELEAARKEIFEQFGPDVGEILRRSRAAREAERANAENPLRSAARPSHPLQESKVLKSAMASRAASPDPMSPSRLERQIRFAELTPKDVYVYESAPPSPPKQVLALPAPTDDDGPIVSLGEFQGKMSATPVEPEDVPMSSPPQHGDNVPAQPTPEPETDRMQLEEEPEEGTPEYIRRRFFPNVSPNDPSLAWIEGPRASIPSTALELRFDLSGSPITPELSRTLPVHLGLHHHSEGTHAGYTLDDIFLLSRSTVPAQRAAMLGILGSIALKLSHHAIQGLHGHEPALRKRILAAGVEAMAERGSVGVRAVEVIWSCVVAWHDNESGNNGIELKNSSDDTLNALPLDSVMKQVSDDFDAGALPHESLSQLLAVIHCFARHSNALATAITSTPNLVANLLKRFLLLPATSDVLPEPLAIQVLATLALSSRENATVVADSAPTLLRFIVILPSSSLYAIPLATSLIICTLNLYRALASYGLCAQLATTASEHLNKFSQFVLSAACTSDALRNAWLELVEGWSVCAIDPHRTTPEHDILWSQVVGWEWGKDILELGSQLSATDHSTWAALWRAEAVWLEGCGVNGVKGGEAEKALTAGQIRGGFERGIARQVVEHALQELSNMLSTILMEDLTRIGTWGKLSQCSELLASAIRLWLACLPPALVGPITSPPFMLPVSQISAVCAQLTTHPLWTALDSPKLPREAHVHLRSLVALLSSYLYLSRASPGTSPALWLAQAFSIITRYRQGDEEQTVFTLSAMRQMVTSDVVQMFGWPTLAFSDNSGLDPILPLLLYSVEHGSSHVGSHWMSPSSISRADTQRLPYAQDTSSKSALPLPKDWLFFPLDHLLRSGQTEAFKFLPPSWNFSETDIARATLLSAKIHRHVLGSYQLNTFTLSLEETVFSCMKVFMLEHDQQQQTSLQEVFRDPVVNQLMEDLLEPFTLAFATNITREASTPTLEHVSKRFLGSGTPFYQYYTDFVALYDSISFSHPLFARLLLPPISMRYPSDYRKYLWAEFSHILRTIRVPIASVITQGLQEYLWPLEDNPEVLAAYVRSLVKGQTEGTIRFLAVHHVACNIWPDLRQGTDGDERAMKLLQAVVGQAGFEAIQNVVSYRQSHEATVLPPQCFEGLQEVKTVRREFAVQCGREVEERLRQLLT